MREILLKGKTKTGIWIEGFLFQTECDGAKKWNISMSPLSANDYSEILGDYGDVIPETVGQYTGLTDKNGKKIFEGEILEITREYYNRKEKSLYKVRYHEATASFCAFAIDFLQRVPLCQKECRYYEIIGNIHDNPELLKGDDTDA